MATDHTTRSPDRQDIDLRLESLDRKAQEFADWGFIVRALADSDEPIDGHYFGVIGNAVDTLAGHMSDDLRFLRLARGRGL